MTLRYPDCSVLCTPAILYGSERFYRFSLLFIEPLGRALKNSERGPNNSPCFSRWLRSSSLLFESSRSHKKNPRHTKVCRGFLVRPGGFEPLAFRVGAERSNPAELRSHNNLIFIGVKVDIAQPHKKIKYEMSMLSCKSRSGPYNRGVPRCARARFRLKDKKRT